eukprot:8732554-Pyramimonas_sp.AAC.1
MLRSGMIGYVKNMRERVGVFTVVKNLNEQGTGVEKSRLVWDCRRVNLLFQDPPWVPLGSPASLA